MGRTKGKPAMRNESVDSLIPKGLALKVMAKLSGYTGKEGVWDYLNRTKQLEDWHRSRSKPSYLCPFSLLIGAVGSGIVQQLSAPVDDIANIVQMVQIRAYNNASDDERRAFDYLQFVIRSNYNWAGPLHRYFVARGNGEVTRSIDLCEGFSVSQKGLCAVLGVLDLKPLGRPGRLPKKKANVHKVLFECKEGQGEAAEYTYFFFEDYRYSYLYNPDSVFRVITMYLIAEKIGERAYVSKLSRVGKMSEQGVSRIFDFFGWQKTYKTPLKLTPEHKAMIQRAFSLEMCVPDVAYFYPDLNQRAFEEHFARMGKRPIRKSWRSHLGPVRTNRLASQIYELDDQRLSGREKMFDRAEIAEFLDTSLKRVSYALKYRRIIESKIIHALRVMYDNPGINTPYLSGR